jgi:hypothetical protein
METLRPWLLLCGAIAGYLLLMFGNPVRASLRDGFRALRRYPSLWVTLGLLGFCYQLFKLAERVYFHFVLLPGDRPEFVWMREAWRDPNLRLAGSPESLWWLPRADFLASLHAAVLPSIESVAGIFNNAVITFPVAALAAALLLVNWQGHHGVINRALRKRFGHFGWLVHSGIVVCALAALAKPLLYAAPQLFGMADHPAAATAWYQWAPVIEWLASLFEYLFGVFIQLYLILLAYAWVRGLEVTRQHLVDFALRRCSYVMKWAALVMLLGSVLINFPLILKNFVLFVPLLPGETTLMHWQDGARLGLSIFLLLTAAMQITLTFHSESLPRALRDHLRFLGRCWWPFVCFLAVAFVHLFALQLVGIAVARGLGEGTALWVAWELACPWFAGILTAWLLASWVCVFHACESGRITTENWIRY